MNSEWRPTDWATIKQNLIQGWNLSERLAEEVASAMVMPAAHEGQKDLAGWILGNFSLDKALLDCLVDVSQEGLL